MTKMPGQKRTAYAAGFKLKVVAFAEQSNNSMAARHFTVNEKLVRDWRKKKGELSLMPITKKAARGGMAMFPALEEKLAEWIIESRQSGLIVTRTKIRIRALNMSKDSAFQSLKPVDFVASSGWCNRFMNRHALCLRTRTKLAQKLPKDLEEKIGSFQKFVIHLRKQYDFELSQIGNMDETPVCFDIPSNRTVEQKGVKTVFIKTTGHEKTRFTVVLGCMADGSRLPPVIIFKRKTLPKGAKFPSGVVVRAHLKGWMDESGTLEWLDTVWGKRKGALLKKPSMLVWDAFRAHHTDKVKVRCREMKTSVALIPGGLTSLLQPLDVCLNKPFKDRLRAKWIEWMSSSDAAVTKGNNLKKVDIVTIAEWVKEAWLDIPSDMIVRSFKKCSISNAMDGSEDDAIYEEQYDDDDVDSEVEDDIHPDVPMTEDEFQTLFGSSDSDSSFDGFT